MTAKTRPQMCTPRRVKLHKNMRNPPLHLMSAHPCTTQSPDHKINKCMAVRAHCRCNPTICNNDVENVVTRTFIDI